MARSRTGSLLTPLADGMWRGRFFKKLPDGTISRPVYSLGTTDKSLARRKLLRLAAAIERGETPTDAVETANVSDRVREYAGAWLAKRESQGVGMVHKERRTLEMDVFSAIGHLPMCDVRPSHIRGILDDALTRGLKRASIAHVHGVLRRIFSTALSEEVVETNPVIAVRVPKMREVRKERTILSDGEFAKFIACPEVDLELRMLGLVARCEGGMRTGDLHRWDWTMIDCVHFAECFIPRAKTKTPQRLAIPEMLAPFLRAWWERAEKPTSGPVFPVRTGKRAGETKKPLNSYAKRLRRDLFRAGVYRLPPVEVPLKKAGMRADLGKAPVGTMPAPNPHDPLYFETASTLPVDFHSFRRAFASALAESGVNVQHAMHLTAHSDPRVHSRYVMGTEAMRQIPAAAVPRLSVTTLPGAPKSVDTVTVETREESSIATARGNCSNSANQLALARSRNRVISRVKVAPAVGLEPTTRRLTAACSTN